MSEGPTRTPQPSEATVLIEFDEDLENVHVRFPYWGVERSVDVGFGPTWPTIAEVNDRIANAVREVLDESYEQASGMKIDRES